MPEMMARAEAEDFDTGYRRMARHRAAGQPPGPGSSSLAGASLACGRCAILPKLREGGFLQAFLAKGRFAPLLERVPVGVILNDRTALISAALAAASRTVETTER